MKRLQLKKSIVPLQSNYAEIDSFSMFKNKIAVDLVKRSFDCIAFQIPSFNLIARLEENNNLIVTSPQANYQILVEILPTNIKGVYYFFLCPKCFVRKRKLYCIDSMYQCRNCANLSYYSQKLNYFDRKLYMMSKIERYLELRGGSISKKPVWMKQRTLCKKQLEYQQYKTTYYQEAEAAFVRKLRRSNDLAITEPVKSNF